MSTQYQKGPAHLTAESQNYWVKAANFFDFKPHHLRLLTAGCEAWDRMQEARRLIEAEGVVVEDRFG